MRILWGLRAFAMANRKRGDAAVREERGVCVTRFILPRNYLQTTLRPPF
jgi:hypothetical protein